MKNRQLLDDWPVWILLFFDLLAAILVYPHLPARVPMHWNFRGQVDSWGSPFWGAFGPFVIACGVYLLMSVLPAIDPRKNNYTRFSDTYHLLKLIIVFFLLGLHWITLTYALGYKLPVDRVIITAVSALFIVLGNFMGRVRQTYMVGIRTPWTLASEEVWNKTHRLGGRVWVAAGLSGVAGGFLGGTSGKVIFIAAMILAVAIPVVYSYLVYQKTGGQP